MKLTEMQRVHVLSSPSLACLESSPSPSFSGQDSSPSPGVCGLSLTPSPKERKFLRSSTRHLPQYHN
jgi:hypothetical protein